MRRKAERRPGNTRRNQIPAAAAAAPWPAAAAHSLRWNPAPSQPSAEAPGRAPPGPASEGPRGRCCQAPEDRRGPPFATGSRLKPTMRCPRKLRVPNAPKTIGPARIAAACNGRPSKVRLRHEGETWGPAEGRTRAVKEGDDQMWDILHHRAAAKSPPPHASLLHPSVCSKDCVCHTHGMPRTTCTRTLLVALPCPLLAPPPPLLTLQSAPQLWHKAARQATPTPYLPKEPAWPRWCALS